MVAATPPRTAASAQVDRVKSRLAPWLDEPYFTVIEVYQARLAQRCTHENHGFDLETADRKAICKGCHQSVDLFDVLVHYAHAETRLLRQWHDIKEAQKRAADKKQRERNRRPFARKRVGATAIRDMRLKDEPIIGYKLELECGHFKDCGPNRRPKIVTCTECQQTADAQKRRATP